MIVELFYIKKSRSPDRSFLVFLCDFLKISFCATDLVFAFQVTYNYIYIYIYIYIYYIYIYINYIYIYCVTELQTWSFKQGMKNTVFIFFLFCLVCLVELKRSLLLIDAQNITQKVSLSVYRIFSNLCCAFL